MTVFLLFSLRNSPEFQKLLGIAMELFLLCSDGLSNVVGEQEILYEVMYGENPEDCCQRLLEIALKRGAPDNVTVVLVQHDGSQ